MKNEELLMNNHQLSIINKILIVFLLSGFLSTSLQAQSLLVEQVESTVVIERDNLVRAKADALKEAKEQVILQAVSKFLDFNDMAALKPLLLQHFLEQPDEFIESIRVISEGNTSDLAEFTIKIETQIFRSRLLGTFRKLGIPTQDERIPFQDVFLIYDADSALREQRILDNFLKQLQTRLRPYRIRIKVFVIKNRTLPIEAGLPARLSILPNFSTKNNNGTMLALLELKLRLNPQPKQSQQGNLKANLIFWSQEEDIPETLQSETNASTMLSYSAWQPDDIIPAILDKLLLKWTPVISRALAMNQGSGTEVKFKFKGLPGPIEEQLLVKALFNNNPQWKNLTLDTIAINYVSYQALFLENTGKILPEFKVPQDSPFGIKDVYWEDSYLVVDVKWNELAAPLEPFLTTLLESGLTEKENENEDLPFPNLQVPLRTFKQTYDLPLKSTVYDHIRHRGDSTLFRIETEKYSEITENKKVINFNWMRLGRTNLRPKLTLFDKNRKKIRSYWLGKKNNLLFKYTIPDNEQVFYLRIADEVGFLKDVAGSYQSFRYIITLN